MKAALYEGVGRIKIVDIPKPIAGPGEIVCKVDYCGICGTDIHAYMHEDVIGPGTVLGHEQVGTIVEVGSNVEGLRVGDRIIPTFKFPCNCYYHRHGIPRLCLGTLVNQPGVGTGTTGSYAEYIKCTGGVKIPDNVSLEDAVLWDIFCTALGGIRKSNFKIGDNVVVVGCGAIGLAAVQLLRLGGASHITALSRSLHKRELALQFGADLALNPNEEPNLKEKIEAAHYTGVGADVTFELAGTPEGVALSVNLCKNGGQAILLGISPMPLSTINETQLVIREVEIKSSFIYDEEEVPSFVRFLSSGRLNTKGMVTEIIKLDDIPEVMERLSKTTVPIRVVIKP